MLLCLLCDFVFCCVLLCVFVFCCVFLCFVVCFRVIFVGTMSCGVMGCCAVCFGVEVLLGRV